MKINNKNFINRILIIIFTLTILCFSGILCMMIFKSSIRTITLFIMICFMITLATLALSLSYLEIRYTSNMLYIKKYYAVNFFRKKNMRKINLCEIKNIFVGAESFYRIISIELNCPKKTYFMRYYFLGIRTEFLEQLRMTILKDSDQ